MRFCTIRHRLLVSALLVTSLAAGCGGGGGGDSPASSPSQPANSSADYFPLKSTDRWVYQTNSGQRERVRVGKTDSTSLETELVVGYDDAISTQLARVTKSAREVKSFPAENSDPIVKQLGPLTLMRFPLIQGDTFIQADKTLNASADFDGDGRNDTIQFQSEVSVIGFEAVTTSAGNFADCARIQTSSTVTILGSARGSSTTTTSVSTDWYAPNIGFIKNQTEIRSGAAIQKLSRELIAFRVGAAQSDTKSPVVVSLDPTSNSISGPRGRVVLEFNEDLDPDSITSDILSIKASDGSKLNGTISYNTRKLTYLLNSSTDWRSGTYTVAIAGSVSDLAANLVTPQSWQLQIDTTGPTLVRSTPEQGAIDVPLDTVIRIEFNESLDLRGAPETNIGLQTGGNSVPITVSVIDSKTLTIKPLLPLNPRSTYTVNIGTNVRDIYGNSVDIFQELSFKTLPGVFSYSDFIDLREATQGALAIGDLNGDGLPDLVYSGGDFQANKTRHVASIRYRSPSGELGTPIGISSADCSFAASITIVDFNRDGLPDLVTSGDCGVEVFLQKNDHTFARSVYLAYALGYQVRVVDINGDGLYDLIGVGRGGINILLQNKSGMLEPPQIVPMEESISIRFVVADVNADGRQDIVAKSSGYQNGRAIALILQNADGTFAAPLSLPLPVGEGTNSYQGELVVADMNSDGRNDIVVAVQLDSAQAGSIEIFNQTAESTFKLARSIPTVQSASAMAISDLNADGKLDIVICSSGGFGAMVHTQNADGTFAPYLMKDAPYSVWSSESLAIGNLSGNSLPDIAMGAYGFGIDLFTNRNSPPANFKKAGLAAVLELAEADARVHFSNPNAIKPSKHLRP